MEFRINKTIKPILRPASKSSFCPKEDNPVTKALSSNPKVESVRFIDIKSCSQCKLIFKNADSLSMHALTHG